MSEPEGVISCVCDTAKSNFNYYRFPAYSQEASVLSAEKVVEEDEATCYNHPDKVAVAACEACGMFACPLCLVQMGRQRVCLNCFNRKHQDGTSGDASSSHRYVYDSIALSLAVIPMLIPYLTIITAPIVLFIVIRYWKKHPCSEIPRSRIRFIMALVFACLQILFWGFMLVVLIAEGGRSFGF